MTLSVNLDNGRSPECWSWMNENIVSCREMVSKEDKGI